MCTSIQSCYLGSWFFFLLLRWVLYNENHYHNHYHYHWQLGLGWYGISASTDTDTDSMVWFGFFGRDIFNDSSPFDRCTTTFKSIVLPLRGSFRTCIHGHQPGIPVCHIGSFISHITSCIVYRVSCIVLLTWPISHQTLIPSFISHYLVPNGRECDLESQTETPGWLVYTYGGLLFLSYRRIDTIQCHIIS